MTRPYGVDSPHLHGLKAARNGGFFLLFPTVFKKFPSLPHMTPDVSDILKKCFHNVARNPLLVLLDLTYPTPSQIAYNRSIKFRVSTCINRLSG